MDSRTVVRPVAKDDSSEEEARMSTDPPSVDDDVDSDKGSGNSKKRKRGSYRCSRCGMPKRGHNCPDTFEGVHFAIVESPPPTVTTPGAKPGSAKSGNPTQPTGSSPRDEASHETLLMLLNNLREENMRLMHDNQHLHEVCQYQARALHHFQGSPHAPEFAPHGAPMMPHPNAPNTPGMFGNGPAMPHFNQLPFQGQPPSQVPQPLVPGFVSPPSLPHNASLPPNAHAASVPHNQRLTAHSNPQFPPDDDIPPPKRAKLEDPSNSGSYLPSGHGSASSLPHGGSHPYLPMTASPFLHDLPEMNRLSSGPRPVPVGPSQFEYDYDCNEWQDNDSSTSEYYPQFNLDASPPLIY